jgi:hypothetical protein
MKGTIFRVEKISSARETMSLLGWHFEEDILRLFHHVLTSSYFSFAGQFYKQVDGMAMGSPLSPVIANFYMEDFEEMPLDQASQKPLYWFQYVDDNLSSGHRALTDCRTSLTA